MCKIELTLNQCRQISKATDLREFVVSLNERPEWLKTEMGVDGLDEIRNIADMGCASNAHASCWYADANKFMSEYGDEVVEFIEGHDIEIKLEAGESWHQFASKVLQTAVELYCNDICSKLPTDLDWE